LDFIVRHRSDSCAPVLWCGSSPVGGVPCQHYPAGGSGSSCCSAEAPPYPFLCLRNKQQFHKPHTGMYVVLYSENWVAFNGIIYRKGLFMMHLALKYRVYLCSSLNTLSYHDFKFQFKHVDQAVME